MVRSNKSRPPPPPPVLLLTLALPPSSRSPSTGEAAVPAPTPALPWGAHRLLPCLLRLLPTPSIAPSINLHQTAQNQAQQAATVSPRGSPWASSSPQQLPRRPSPTAPAVHTAASTVATQTAAYTPATQTAQQRLASHTTAQTPAGQAAVATSHVAPHTERRNHGTAAAASLPACADA